MSFEISILNTAKESDWTTVLEVKSVKDMSSLASIIKVDDWSHSIFSENRRSLKTFMYANVIALDFDQGLSLSTAIQIFAKYEHIIIPTKSHAIPKANSSAEDRFRVVLRLSRRVCEIREFNAISSYLLKLHPQADHNAKDAARYWKCGFHEAVSVNNDGKLIDVDSIIDSDLMLAIPLSNHAESFITQGAPDGKFNSSLFKAAKECAEKGLPKEEFIHMSEPNCRDKIFDESDLRTIDSAYKADDQMLGGIDPRKESTKLELLQNKLIMDIENDKRLYSFNEEEDIFSPVSLNAIKFHLTCKEFTSHKTQRGFSAKVIYNPHSEKPRLFVNGADTFFNVYKNPKWRTIHLNAPYTIPQVYEDFFMHLTGNDSKSYDYLLRWLANSIQSRNRTILVAVGDQGIGKGVLGQILECLHGKENYSLTSDVILKEKFNSPLRDKRLVHIDEINISKNSNAYNRLKVLIEDSIQVEEKGKDQKVIENHASIYLCSNDLDSLPLDDDQRRFSVIELTDLKLQDAEFVNIAGGINRFMKEVVDETNIASLGSYLLNLKIDQDQMQKPFLSARTKILREANLKQWEEWFIYTWCPQNYNPLTESLYEFEKRVKPEIKKEFPELRSAPGREKLENLAKRFPGHFIIQRKDNKRFIKVLPPANLSTFSDPDELSLHDSVLQMLDSLEVS